MGRTSTDKPSISQEELCYLANISKNQIGNIERGEVNETISTVFALAKSLQIEIIDLFKFE
ncbi:hypothetical protein GCM10011514_35690 [Emticicia aquatilis]|uniref:HTH cro/C1-type domain-containing protein n=1 Tax=Emticicia aquatilis TaxID=1537369 RepID=A0A917DT30_9BACT|nr:helix-turn-helix transcriptional regulator [Emticicia aquatilis]GGD68448.1 hypothetical protein GCM10011514_35690 [Emticicia aquatilis]